MPVSAIDMMLIIVLLCTVATRLCSADDNDNYDTDDELIAELDLLLPNSGDNIQVSLQNYVDPVPAYCTAVRFTFDLLR